MTTAVTSQMLDQPAPVVFSSYLDDLTASARSRNVSWQTHQSAGLISDAELGVIQEFMKAPRDVRLQMISNSPMYLQAFYGVLGKVASADTLQSTLLVLDDIFAESNAATLASFSLVQDNPGYPFKVLNKLLDKDDELVRLLSAKLVTRLLVSEMPPGADLGPIYAHIASELASGKPEHVDIAAQNLQSVLSVLAARREFFRAGGGKGVQSLVSLLRQQNNSPQMQYQVIFCFWLLSFDEEVAREIQKKFDVIQPLLDACKSAVKEKVVRVVVATYRNLLEKAPEANATAMIGNKALPFLDVLSQRNFSDEEIANDLEYLKTELREILNKLSSFDEYSGEVRSTRLEWSPAHTSELFWKANATKLNENNHELLKILSRVLVTSNEPLVLCVAAHDIGQYVKYYPAGKKLLQDIGTKQRIMELMGHEDGDVRYQALIAVQKYMANSWGL
ncbi:H(+)-transporting V1 sector ATPase subunit H [Sorochytrium milnesiophthora]